MKQLPEKVHELDVHLTEMMKAVNTSLAKKENDDDSKASPVPEEKKGGGGGAAFTKIAGANLGKIMYHKMMTTEPDQTARNVRVETKMNAVQLSKHEQRRLLDPDFESSNPPPSAQHFMAGKLNNTEDDEEAAHKGVVDRDTVKKLAKLVLMKDAAEKKRKKLMERLEREDDE